MLPDPFFGLTVSFSIGTFLSFDTLSEDVRRTKGRRLVKEQFHRPFDLQQGLLLRVTLLKLREQSHALLLCMHHIISDAWPMEIMFNEFKTLYAAYVHGQPSPLPDPPIRYADYAIWQRGWLQGDVLNEQLDYWKKQLTGIPALQLPFDHPRPVLQTFRGAVRNMLVPSAITNQLNLAGPQHWRNALHGAPWGLPDTFISLHGSALYSCRHPYRGAY